MFSRYFSDRFFPVRYWPNNGAAIVVILALPDVEVIVVAQVTEVIVRPHTNNVIGSVWTEVLIPAAILEVQA